MILSRFRKKQTNKKPFTSKSYRCCLFLCLHAEFVRPPHPLSTFKRLHLHACMYTPRGYSVSHHCAPSVVRALGNTLNSKRQILDFSPCALLWLLVRMLTVSAGGGASPLLSCKQLLTVDLWLCNLFFMDSPAANKQDR